MPALPGNTVREECEERPHGHGGRKLSWHQAFSAIGCRIMDEVEIFERHWRAIPDSHEIEPIQKYCRLADEDFELEKIFDQEGFYAGGWREGPGI